MPYNYLLYTLFRYTESLTNRFVRFTAFFVERNLASHLQENWFIIFFHDVPQLG